MTIDLVWFGDDPQLLWQAGAIHTVSYDLASISKLIEEQASRSQADAWLFWDGASPLPPDDLLNNFLAGTGDVWHAGLRLGTGGQPGTADFVAPLWLLNLDPNIDIEATSWRLSLRAALVRREVLRTLGGPSSEFSTLDAAVLSMGHRWIDAGAIVRHVPSLISSDVSGDQVTIPLVDELRFVLNGYGRKWLYWAAMRAILTGYAPLADTLRALNTIGASASPSAITYRRKISLPDVHSAVSVVIPTLERYSYLDDVLNGLAAQTLPPAEVRIVDQTDEDHRDASLASRYASLPLHRSVQPYPGQSTARRDGVEQAQSELVLLLDDDVELPSDLIARHVAALHAFQAEAICGGVLEVDAGLLPLGFQHRRISTIFPATNTIARRDAVIRAGNFDPLMDRTDRDDGDLGIRLHLSGALMIYDPDITVIHHHAPRGGLRRWGERRITYAISRQHILWRKLPSVGEMLLAQKYFTARQQREMIWLAVLGTFSMRGGILRQAAKVVVAFVLLPDTVMRILSRRRKAKHLLHENNIDS